MLPVRYVLTPAPQVPAGRFSPPRNLSVRPEGIHARHALRKRPARPRASPMRTVHDFPAFGRSVQPNVSPTSGWRPFCVRGAVPPRRPPHPRGYGPSSHMPMAGARGRHSQFAIPHSQFLREPAPGGPHTSWFLAFCHALGLLSPFLGRLAGLPGQRAKRAALRFEPDSEAPYNSVNGRVSVVSRETRIWLGRWRAKQPSLPADRSPRPAERHILPVD